MAQSEKYHEQIECLRHICLEEPFVLGLIEGQNSIEFELEAVLTPEHPSYHPPKPNAQHCYKKFVLRLDGCSSVNWIRKSLRPTIDANGEVDFGNMDHFGVAEDLMHLEGEWGEVLLSCAKVSLRAI